MSKPFVDGVGDDIKEAYEDVRSDGSETNWFVAGYDNGGQGKLIEVRKSGVEYEEFLEQMEDDQRIYGYVRFVTGDEMSTRSKFAFITWIGPNIGPLKKAKVSTDKAFVKEICKDFGKEFLADVKSEVKEKTIKDALEKASGAAYGTGQR